MNEWIGSERTIHASQLTAEYFVCDGVYVKWEIDARLIRTEIRRFGSDL